MNHMGSVTQKGPLIPSLFWYDTNLRPPYGVPADILAFSHKILLRPLKINYLFWARKVWHLYERERKKKHTDKKKHRAIRQKYHLINNNLPKNCFLSENPVGIFDLNRVMWPWPRDAWEHEETVLHFFWLWVHTHPPIGMTTQYSRDLFVWSSPFIFTFILIRVHHLLVCTT